MADKRPIIHLFFALKKRKQTESTEDTKPPADLSTSIDNINRGDIPNQVTPLIVIDDDSEVDASSSFVDDQSEEKWSKCEFACCASSTVYVPTTESELQSTLMKEKRCCQLSWFKAFSWLTFLQSTLLLKEDTTFYD